jgi:hypothetical protein
VTTGRLSTLLVLAAIVAGVGAAGSGAAGSAESVTITDHPATLSASTQATFAFIGTSGVTAFRCELDGSRPAECTSPKTYTGLAQGKHTFTVRGFRGTVDLGVSDTYTWTIDSIPPETTITTQVPAKTKAASVTLAFTASEPGATFECKLDAASFQACVSPTTVSPGVGTHAFAVRARDQAGNVDPSPATVTWEVVKNLPPVARVGFLARPNTPKPVTGMPLVGVYTLPAALKGASNVTGPPGAFEVIKGKLVVSAGAQIPKVIEGKTYQFSGAASTDADGKVVHYEWSVFDGGAYKKKQEGESAIFATSFESVGGWGAVRLVVVDDEGASASAELLVKVDADCTYAVEHGRFRAQADCFRRQTLKKSVLPPPKKGGGPTSPVTVTTTLWTTYPAGSPALVNGITVDPEGKTPYGPVPLVVEMKGGSVVEGSKPPEIVVKSARARVTTPEADLYLGTMKWRIEHEAIWSFTLGGKLQPKLRGLKITGLASLLPPVLTPSKGAAMKLWVALPTRLGAVTSDTPVTLTTGGGSSPAAFRAPSSAAASGDLSFTVQHAAITPWFTVRKLKVSYQAAPDLWTLDGRILIDALGYEALLSLEIKAGSLQKITAALDNLNLCAAVLVCLQKLSLDIVLGKTEDTYAGGIGLSLLQKVAGASIATIDGSLALTFQKGGPHGAVVGGTVNLFGAIPVAKGGLGVSTSGFVHAWGGMTYGFKGLASIEGKLDVWYYKPKLNAYGEIEGCIFDLVCAGGQALVSTKGVAACLIIDLELDDWRPGIGYKWGDTLPTVFFAGCDVGPYKEKLPGLRVAAGASAQTLVPIPAGLPGAVIAVRGATAPPKVTLVGPKGEQVSTPLTGPGYVRQRPFLLVEGEPTKTTYIAIWKPSPGDWKVLPLAGSSPIVAVQYAEGLPAPQVTAKVSGSGQKRTLSYSFTPRPGQVITFWEEGAAPRGGVPTAGHLLGEVVSKAAGRRQEGTLQFAPAEGAAGTRRIVAQVEQDGLVRRVLRVATYTAPGGPTVGKPVGLDVKRERGTLTIAWQAAANATTHIVRVELEDGRRLLLPVVGGKTQVVVSGVPSAVGGSVTVTGVRGTTGSVGPAATIGIPG